MSRVAILTLSLFLLARTGSAQPSDQPPQHIPASCPSITIAELTSEEGSDTFHFLRFEVAALQVAHTANSAPLEAIAQSKKEDSHMGISTILTGMSASEDGFTCAASVMGRYNPTTDEQKAVRSTSIAVYNGLADFSTQMKARVVRKLSPNGNEGVSEIDDAQEYAALTKKHDDSVSILIDAVGLSLMLSQTTGTDPNKVDTWNMSCKERRTLLTELEPYRVRTKSFDDFQKMANLIQDALTQHPKCK